ncbi:putative quinol monooxygenase [Streptomyces sp. cg2]|uniref:putative quinol monooxygenase n=1 Tax=Streptomyces sp. cg2 TaxID=3238799 RepID=UPI0034E1A170
MVGSAERTRKRGAISQRITAVGRLPAKPGREAEMREQARSMVTLSLAEPGCLSYRNYLDPGDPRSWVVVEWRSGSPARPPRRTWPARTWRARWSVRPGCGPARRSCGAHGSPREAGR